jgi:hypothetical protein
MTKPFDAARFLHNIETFLAQCEAYIQSADPDARLPDPAPLRHQLPPSGAIEGATPGHDAHGPYIAVVVDDPADPNRDVTPRLFDPWYFVVIVLLAAAGVPLTWL